MTNPTTTNAAFYVAYEYPDRCGLAHRSTTLATATAKMARLTDRPGHRFIVAISGTYRPDKVSTTRPGQVAMFLARNDVRAIGTTLPAWLLPAAAPVTVPAVAEPVTAPEPQPEPEPDLADDLADLFDDLADEYGSEEAAIMADLDYRSALAGIDF